LNQSKDELEECIRNQDFSKAAELKTTVSELESEKSALLEAGESQVEEIRTEKVGWQIGKIFPNLLGV